MQTQPFSLDFQLDGAALRLDVACTAEDGGVERFSYQVEDKSRGFLGFHVWLAETFGTRRPANADTVPPPTFEAVFVPVLTENISADILYGYGDPSMMRVANPQAASGWDYYLTFTSNDAVNSFPILHSEDMHHWTLHGFAYPDGSKPAWIMDGPGVSDFWAPEIHAVGSKYILCYTAREQDGTLAIGIAEADHPAGPFTGPDRPLITGGVIDSHIFVEKDGTPYMFWKEDNNDVWPKLLIALMAQAPEVIEALFPAEADRRTAQVMAALLPVILQLQPMEQAMMLEPVIDAAAEDYIEFRARVLDLLEKSRGQPYEGLVQSIKTALATPFFMQQLDAERLELVGERKAVIENDQNWEGHIIEGMYIFFHDGHYYMFYAGNSFGNHKYGIGVAVADRLDGPYTKLAGPFLQSTAAWTGPGHPSVILDLQDRPTLVFHAFPPNIKGYKAFRAFLLANIDLQSGKVSLRT